MIQIMDWSYDRPFSFAPQTKVASITYDQLAQLIEDHWLIDEIGQKWHLSTSLCQEGRKERLLEWAKTNKIRTRCVYGSAQNSPYVELIDWMEWY